MAAEGRRGRLDLTSIAGIPIGIGLILVGQAIEGGAAHTLLQTAAALIVFGGTAGAVLLSHSTEDVVQAASSIRRIFLNPIEPVAGVIERITAYAVKARRSGVMSIEDEANAEPDPFLKRALSMAVDGISQSQIRAALEVEMDSLADHEERPARVFEAAGGYAPTIGILGAVLGLIHVMENLTDPAKLGPGIAVAFVATVYGVGSANLILLPLAAKLRQRAREATRRRELLVDGVLAIQDGLNPRLIQQRLARFVVDAEVPGPAGAPAVRNALPEEGS
jgi:chemotaxis protein MotA